MTTQEKKALRAQYPKKLTLDNVRCISHIGKRKASWLLANGYIKCKNNGKKTRQYSIHIKDLFTYIDTAESNLLRLDEVAVITDCALSSVQKWTYTKKLQCLWAQAKVLPTREWLINFFINHGYCIIRKSDVHLRLLQKFYNQQ